MARAAIRAIYKHAFWLYGVLVGVALKEALETGVSHLVEPDALSHQLLHINITDHFPHEMAGISPEVIRLVVFLLLVVRFYLGSAFYFGAVYEAPGAEERFPVTNYPADFFSGFLHFVCFVILALVMNIHTTPFFYFPLMVGIILAWDVGWFAASFRRTTAKMIFWWMLVNVFTAAVALATYLVVEVRYSSDPMRHLRAERWAFYWVIIVSLADLGLMMYKRPFFQPLGKWVPRDDMLDPPDKTPDPAEPVPD